MNILIVSGLASTTQKDGLYKLADKLKLKYPVAIIKQCTWDQEIPQINYDLAVGHSYGVSSIYRLLAKNETIGIKLLVSLDGVPNWTWGLTQTNQWVQSKKVDRMISYYRFSMLPPWSCKIISGSNYKNILKFWMGHNSFPDSDEIHNEILGYTE